MNALDQLPKRLRVAAAEVIKAVAEWVLHEKAMPKNDDICARVGCRKTALRALLVVMQKARLIELEITESARRIRLPDGEWTRWAKWTANARKSRRGTPWRTRLQQARAKKKRLDEGVPRTNEHLFGEQADGVLLLRRRGYSVVLSKNGFVVDGRLRTMEEFLLVVGRNRLSPFSTQSTPMATTTVHEDEYEGGRRRRAVDRGDKKSAPDEKHHRRHATGDGATKSAKSSPPREKRNGGSKRDKPARYPRRRGRFPPRLRPPTGFALV